MINNPVTRSIGTPACSTTEQHCLELLQFLHLDDLQGEVPLELLAQLYMTCDHIMQKGSWEPCPPEHVAEYFRTKFFPKYLSGRQ